MAQSTVLPHLRLFGVTPDIVLLFTVSWALLQGVREGLLVALIGGLVLDALSAGPFGAQTLVLAVVGLLAGLGGANIFRTERLLPYAAAAAATVLYYGLMIAMLFASGRVVLFGPMMVRLVLPVLVLNELGMAAVHAGAVWMRGFFVPSPVEWE